MRNRPEMLEAKGSKKSHQDEHAPSLPFEDALSVTGLSILSVHPRQQERAFAGRRAQPLARFMESDSSPQSRTQCG